jgi:hypothetical protein
MVATGNIAAAYSSDAPSNPADLIDNTSLWWDAFPCLALPGDANLSRMQEAALRTMARILGFQSPVRRAPYTGSDIGTRTMIVRCAQLSMLSSPRTPKSTRASSVKGRRSFTRTLD